MLSPCCLYVNVYPPTNFPMTEPIFMRLSMYNREPDPISTAYFINPCASLCVYLLSLLGNGSVKTLPREGIHTQQ
jgi:hypothetical protein